MDKAAMNVCKRIYRSDGSTESGQVICTGNEDILHATVTLAVEYNHPVPDTFVFTNPHAQYILLNDPSLITHIVVNGIQNNYGIDTFLRSMLPFPGFLQHFVGDLADGAFGTSIPYISLMRSLIPLQVIPMMYMEIIFPYMPPLTLV